MKKLCLLLAICMLLSCVTGCDLFPTDPTEPSVTETTENSGPEDSKPAESNPAESQPVDTKPVETKPVETQPQPTVPAPTQPEPSVPQPTVPEPTQPEPTVPQPTVPEPTQPEPTVPQPTVPEPTQPEPTVPQPTVPEPTQPEPTVPAPILVQRINISGNSKVTVGNAIQLTAEVLPADAEDKRVSWSIISGSEFASISAGGFLTAKGVGKVTVQAESMDGSYVTSAFYVTVIPVAVTSIAVSGPNEVLVGDTAQLVAAVKPDNAANKEVTWSVSSGSSYGSVSDTGLFTAKAKGTVTLKATAKDGSGVSATFKITVKTTPVTKITISGPGEVIVGSTAQLTAAVSPDNATNKQISWSVSSGSSYASVSADGVVTAKAVGTATIKATAKDGSGVTATYKIMVTEPKLWEGSGTENDPFLIRNLNDLMNLQKVTKKSGYYFRQVADIDCASVDTWIVIGDMDNPFRHHIDGGGYTISNLCFDGEATALFQVVEDSHFKNMNIVNAHSSDNHVTYPNNTGKYPGGGSTAAIAGFGMGCSFENCTAVVDFQSSNESTGGLIGAIVLKEDQKTLMENCHVSGTITSCGHTGGLIARISQYGYDSDWAPDYDLPVKNCSTDVNIVIFTVSSERDCVGGLIGEANGVWIEQCHAKGTINVIDGDIGGLVGEVRQNVNITRCYAEVDIYASSDYHYGGVSIGGLIGHMYSRNDVYDCYATGNISAPYVEWSPCQDELLRNGGPWRKYYNPCGSLIGTLEVFKAYSEDQKINVYNCYATGKVNVPNICEDKRVYCHGALIGLVLDAESMYYVNVKDRSKKDQSSWDDLVENYIGHFGDNYNLEDLRTYYEPINDYEYRGLSGLQNAKYTALPKHDYVEIVTEAQLKNQATFEGWDFTNVWVMGANGPELR